jgi:hypothetical protein
MIVIAESSIGMADSAQKKLCLTQRTERTVATNTLYDSAEPLRHIQCIPAISSILCVRLGHPDEL